MNLYAFAHCFLFVMKVKMIFKQNNLNNSQGISSSYVYENVNNFCFFSTCFKHGDVLLQHVIICDAIYYFLNLTMTLISLILFSFSLFLEISTLSCLIRSPANVF